MVGELVTPLLKKSFSRDEKSFYNILSNGIDENLLYVLSWLKTHESSELLDAEDEDEFEELFALSNLHAELNNRIQRNTLNGIKPLSRFYKVGSRLAYYDLKKEQHYTKSDRAALKILTQYVGDTVYSVNVDSCLGIKDILMMGALGGLALSKLSDEILKSPYTMSKHSGATVDTRCAMISVTEYSRSVNTGLLQGYVNNGVFTVDIKTAGDDRVCDDCLEIEANNPYPIDEAMHLIPCHPDCRCSFSYGNYPLVDADLLEGFVVNMTNNNYTLNDTSSGSGADYDFTFNGF